MARTSDPADPYDDEELSTAAAPEAIVLPASRSISLNTFEFEYEYGGEG